MLRNYFKTTWRNLKTQKAYAVINIAGLAIGIAASFIIYVVIHYEMSYEDKEPNRHRIYRVVANYTNRTTHEPVGQTRNAVLTLPNAIRTELPQLPAVAAVWYFGGAQVHIPIPGKDLADEKRVKTTEGMYWAEPSLFNIFQFQFMAGDGKRLNEPNTCVLSETFARLFFGDWRKAIGQTIQIWSFRVPMQVVGVYKDWSAHTDMEIKLCGSYETLKRFNAYAFDHEDWTNTPWPSSCFVLLPEGATPGQFTDPLQKIVSKYYHPDIKANAATSLALQPLADIHLNEKYETYKEDALTHKELWSLGVTGFFLLLVACVNFINLATAQSVKRAREIGVRKVLGSSKTQILKKFLHETASITTMAVLLGIVLAWLALPFTRNLVGKPLSFNITANPSIIFFLVVLGIVVNFLAGFYPGWVLAAFKPVDAIKSKINTSSTAGIALRRGLVIFQFVIAQLLIIGTIIVLQQMKFFRNQSMGFDKNAVAFIDLPSDSTDQTRYGYLKQQLMQVPGVEDASFMMDAPASFGANNQTFYFNTETLKREFPANMQFADTSYPHLFQIPIVAGRIFYQADTVRELLVNQAMVRKLGFTNDNDILGKTLSFDGINKYPIVGVLKDFNHKSLKEPITPFVLATHSRAIGTLGLRLNPAHMATTLPQLEKKFTGIYPTYMFTLDFLDERIAHFYTSEAMASTLFKIAAFFAIFISCLGLYGLVSFMAAQKTKEVGIRKVLGASVQSIVFLFSKEFILLIGIAFLIAAPVGYYLMHHWLTGFYYHIEMGWWVFAVAIVLSVMIAFITVSYKAVKAALVNPVKSLRTE